MSRTLTPELCIATLNSANNVIESVMNEFLTTNSEATNSSQDESERIRYLQEMLDEKKEAIQALKSAIALRIPVDVSDVVASKRVSAIQKFTGAETDENFKVYLFGKEAGTVDENWKKLAMRI